MTISRRLRFEILRRDNHTCRYCGSHAPDVKLTVDHVMPSTLGGNDDPTNLVTACRDCNAGKSSIAPDAETVADVSADALRWARAMTEAHDQRWADEEDTQAQIAVFDEQWDCWKQNQNGQKLPRPGDWEQTVRHWLKRGWHVQELVPLIKPAMTRQGVAPDSRWRYYCGIIWQEQTELDVRARALVDADNG